MKKKLLYGLMGLLFALSLVGFVACDDDDDDDSSESSDDGDTVVTEYTYDDDGNVTESTETLTTSEGETVTSTTEYTYNEDGSTDTTTTRTDSDGNTTATVEKTTTSGGESSATVEVSTDCSVLLVSSDELEGATSITFTITSVTSSSPTTTWGSLYESANWGGAIEWIFGYPLEAGAEITLGADNLLTWDDYVETGFYIGCGNNGDNEVTLEITYTISTASVTAYTKAVEEKSVTSATQILSASQIASASEIQLVIDGDAFAEFYLIDGTGDGATSYSGLTTNDGGWVYLTLDNDDGLTENLVSSGTWLQTDEDDDDTWVYVDLSSFQANGLWVSSTDGVTVSAGYKKGDSSSANYSGYSSVDLSSVTLSSSAGAQILSSNDLSSASEVVIIFTYDTTDDCWFNVLATSSLDSDSACKFDVGWQSAGTWTLTLTEDSIVLSRGTGDNSYYVDYSWYDSSDNESYGYTLDTYSDSGIYVAAGSSEGYGTVTLDAVYYTTSSSDGDEE